MMEVLHESFVRDCIHMAEEANQRGWHERNGGNLSYRLTAAEATACRAGFGTKRNWLPLTMPLPVLGGDFFLLTGSGKYMSKVAAAPEECLGIIELAADGGSYAVRWGLEKGGNVTSELPTHLRTQALKKRRDASRNRIVYHAHPANLIALTFVVPIDDAAITRELWEADIENPLVFPEGIGIVPWMVPGSEAVATATLAKMERYRAVIWAHHGTFVCGDDFDDAFGLMDSLEKAASICVKIRAMGGKRQAMTNQNLSDLAAAFGLVLHEGALRLGEETSKGKT